MSVEQEILETGIKVVDLLAPYAKGGKIGLFGGKKFDTFTKGFSTQIYYLNHLYLKCKIAKLNLKSIQELINRNLLY